MAASRGEWIEKARTIERLGYATLNIADHFPDRLAVVPAMMSAADATSTLRICSWVFCNDFRHPAVMFKESATLDLLSGGRVEIGIGAGWLKSEYDMAGIPFDPPAVRVARMKEAVVIYKGLARGEPFSFDGDHYRIRDMVGAPRSIQRPWPPLYVGGGGRTLLTFAGREADIAGIAAKARPEGGLDSADVTKAAVARKCRWIKDGANASGNKPELNILIYGLAVTEDRCGAARRLHADMPELSINDLLASPHYLIGTHREIADQLTAMRDELGISYVVINTNDPAHPDDFAGVVELLTTATSVSG